jgi:cytoplasmic iron level regulating protein YaaA (DUF328/UPF0246 family)
MLTVISPAKTLDFETTAITQKNSKPVFSKQSKQLIEVMRNKSAKDLSKLMGISPKLAELNVERYRNFKHDSQHAKQAMLAFKGDVYIGLDAESYGERDFTFAQKNLRILSGLYGVLKPLDLIQPYRLEMGTKLKIESARSLYDFWGGCIGREIASELESHRNKTLINLASNEYFKAIDPKLIPGRLITPVFKDYSNGTYKILSFFAKKARGSMATFIVKNRITKPDDLRQFNDEGYVFNDSYSSEDKWVFTRKAS